MSTTTRRTMLAGATAAAALPFGAHAQGAMDLKGTTVVFASWGGAYQDAEKVSYCEPFEKATGAKVVQDGPMNVAKFRAMAGSGTPDWDVVDITGTSRVLESALTALSTSKPLTLGNFKSRRMSRSNGTGPEPKNCRTCSPSRKTLKR